MTLWDFIVFQIRHNQLAGAAFIAAPTALLTYTIRSLPMRIWEWIKKRIVISIRFNSDQNIYVEAMRFITTKVIDERFTHSYNFRNTTHTKSTFGVITAATQSNLELGYGIHIGFYKRRLVVITRHQEQDNQSSDFKENCVCHFITRSKSLLESFTSAVDSFSLEDKEKSSRILVNSNVAGDEWGRNFPLAKRKAETVITKDDVCQELITFIRNFDQKEDFYKKRGLPYHTGILLEGDPGNGKSSIIHAVASETGRDIFFIDLSLVKNLSALLSGYPNWYKSVLVIEDIDVSGVKTSRDELLVESDTKKSTGITLSALLNSLDGLMSPDGMIVIATTNHLDRLDPALRRPGRFDKIVKISSMEKEQFEQMAKLFDQNPSDYALDYFHPISGATVRQLLLEGGVEAVQNHQKHLRHLSI